MLNSAIISDTSPILTLSKIDRLDLLSNLFDKIYIPKAVFEELSNKQDEAFKNFLSKNFFETKEISNLKYYEKIKDKADYGETQAIALAKEMNLALIVDDGEGRRLAKAENIEITGLIGIIKSNFILEIITLKETQKIIDDIVNISNFRLTDKLIKRISPNLKNPC